MPRPLLCLCALAILPCVALAEAAKGPTLAGKDTPLKPIASGLKGPVAVAVGPHDHRAYVSCMGEGRKGQGTVAAVAGGKVTTFAEGLDVPRGLTWVNEHLFVADGLRVRRFDRKGKATVLADAKAFPNPKLALVSLAGDPAGNLYASAVDNEGKDPTKPGALYRVSPGGRVTTLIDGAKSKTLRQPDQVFAVSERHLLVSESGGGKLWRVRMSDGEAVEAASPAPKDSLTGITRDYHGRLYLTSAANAVRVIGRPGNNPVPLARFPLDWRPSGAALNGDGKSVLVAVPSKGALYALPCTVPGEEVDESELPVKLELAFKDLRWQGWTGVSEKGRAVPHRPIVLTHAGDGSNRVFVATQHGVVHVFPDDQKAKLARVFLDIQDRVTYTDAQDEEGFLGLAFAPDFKKSGVFYVYYTPKASKRLKGEKLVNVVSRFKVSKDDPEKADPASEEVLLRLPKPFWNHNGGTIAFGKDGMLYIAVGDGGDANDPYDNGQRLDSPLGKILRIDVSRADEGLKYAIPKDNPFAGQKGKRGEIWAYGLRNVWRMAFDRKTDVLWAADVGQNLWEEINLVTRGGNYGWNRRESLHPFGEKGVGPNKEMVEPIWEYHHAVGKSVTGGHVYRGTRVKQLEGLYLYADYVAGTVWGLRYDEKKKRVTENRVLRKSGFPVFSFGEDEKGDVYLLTRTGDGRGLYRFAAE